MHRRQTSYYLIFVGAIKLEAPMAEMDNVGLASPKLMQTHTRQQEFRTCYRLETDCERQEKFLKVEKF